MRRREILPQVVVNEDELAVIRENAQAAGLTLSAWIRQSSLSTQPRLDKPAKASGTPNGTPGNPPGAAPAATKRAAPNFRKV
jgi:hypothetical protein